MEKLWAPWRIDYILSKKPEGCIFCDKPTESRDIDNYILYRGLHHFIILNAFPYNNGHMMVVPYRHTATLSGWAPEEQQEMMQLADLCVELLCARTALIWASTWAWWGERALPITFICISCPAGMGIPISCLSSPTPG